MAVAGIVSLSHAIARGNVVAFTGAGISTASGIPDYRGPNGLWTKDPGAARMSTYSDYLSDPEVRRRAWRSRTDHPAWQAEPNAGHKALRDLAQAGLLDAIITQNIDGLHQKAGSQAHTILELHGTIHEAECVQCKSRTPMSQALQRVVDGDPDPACQVCGGIIKSATISFGQSLDQRVLARAAEVAKGCDVMLAIGSSLTVQPAAGLCRVAIDSGAAFVIINAESTPYDDLADLIVRDPIEDFLPSLVESSLGALTSRHESATHLS